MNLRKHSNIIRNDIFLNHENNIAVQCPKGESYTYGELLDYNKILFKHLKERSLVFSLSKNTIGSICGYLTFITNGVVPLMLDAELDQGFLNNLILTYKPEYIWLPSQRIHEIPNGKIIASFFDYSLLKLGSGVKVDLHNDLALLLTTSGSTGSPKLVKISYENIYFNAKSISSYLLINQAERPITALPMYYSFGLSIINSHIINGATILLTNSSFMEKDFWSFIKSYKASSLSGIPYSFEILKKLRFFNMELPYLKTITQAGGKLNDELNREFAEYCNNTGKRFFVMYGQTEASPRMGYLPHDHSISKLGSMGIAIPGGEFSLIDEKGNLIDQSDTLGELVYKGKNVSMGYALCRTDLAKGDENNGVLVTGDMAKRDHDGYYYIVGRKKRFIKLFGNRVSLDETERLLKNIIPDCACIGEDDRMLIFITDESIKKKVENYLSSKTGINSNAFEVIYINKIPRTSSGKTVHFKLDI